MSAIFGGMTFSIVAIDASVGSNIGLRIPMKWAGYSDLKWATAPT
jgi:hypothetical protein